MQQQLQFSRLLPFLRPTIHNKASVPLRPWSYVVQARIQLRSALRASRIRLVRHQCQLGPVRQAAAGRVLAQVGTVPFVDVRHRLVGALLGQASATDFQRVHLDNVNDRSRHASSVHSSSTHLHDNAASKPGVRRRQLEPRRPL